MAVGYQITASSLNNQLGLLAVQLRDLCRDITETHLPIASLGADDPARITALEAAGYSPGDAPSALYLLNVLNTVAAIYYGQATQADLYNFENALSSLWGVR